VTITTTTVPIPDVFHEREAWLEARQPYLGASAVAALFGAHQFITLEQLAAEKRGGTGADETPAMRWGSWVEDAIAEWWADQHGVTVVKPDVMYVRGRLAANPDRLIVGSTSDILEIKNTSRDCHGVSPQWWWQIQAQLACTGAERGHLCASFAGRAPESFVVPRDEVAIDRIDEAVSGFWASLDLGLEPEPAHPIEGVERVLLGAEEADLVRHHLEAKTTAKEWKAEASATRDLIEAMSGAAGRAPGSRITLCDSNGTALARIRIQKGREGFAHRTLLADHPDLARGYVTYGDPVAVIERTR